MMLLVPIEKLPDRPSALVRAALADIEECERDQRYSIESIDEFWERQWHRLSKDRATCNVCAAGAVMAKSLYVNWGETCTPDDFEQDTRKKLMALNEFRQGDIHTALVHIMGYAKNPLEVERRITPYAQSRRLFFRQMNLLADDLEAHGL
jgi:hypothetical protein